MESRRTCSRGYYELTGRLYGLNRIQVIGNDVKKNKLVGSKNTYFFFQQLR